MSEDAGKKFLIRKFLNRVSKGLGFIEDIWIDREIYEHGRAEKGVSCLANSLSGNKISSLTELLKDDLQYCFDNGFFTFRFVTAYPGSGKTTLLSYLKKYIESLEDHNNHSVTFLFSLNDVLAIGGNNSFNVKLYSHILGHTFFRLLEIQNTSIQPIRDDLMKIIFSNDEFFELKAASENDEEYFHGKWNQLIINKPINFESFFFNMIQKIAQVDPSFTFVYLIDELDALNVDHSSASYARAFFRSLINKAHEKFEGEIKLMIYLVGISDDVKQFLQGDTALEERITPGRIYLVPGKSKEFESIRLMISERIKSAYQGCQDFPQAWKELNEINLNRGTDYTNLREFCQKYAKKVIEIHERYFTIFDETYNLFEDKARQYVESECRKIWGEYLKQKAYTIVSSKTTKFLEGNCFDCYIELLHNDKPVARAFGEAKNFELLASHLKTFEKWLKDVNFKHEAKPPELAFLIAPSCPSLLKRKIELANIRFIQAEKIITPVSKKIDKHETIKTDEREKVFRELDNKTIVEEVKTDDLIVSLTANTEETTDSLGTAQGIRTKEFHEILESKKITLSERRIQEIAKANKVPSEWGYRAAKIKNQWRWFPL
jgi:hypothetical protein